MPGLDLEGERRAIEGSLGATEEFVVTVLTEPTLDRLREALLAEGFHVVHFMGHGGFDAETGEGALVLQDKEGKARRVGGREIAQTLSGADGVRLAFLNACDTARATAEDRANPFAGVAAAMVRGGVPVVVAMQFPITDAGAAEFSATFYRRLALGDVIEAAVTEGRLALYARGRDRAEWFAPALFARAAGEVVLGKRGRAVAVGEVGTESDERAAPVARESGEVLMHHGGRAAGNQQRRPATSDQSKGERERTKPPAADKGLTGEGDGDAAAGSAFEGIQTYTASVLRQVEIGDEEARQEHRTWSRASLVAAGVGFGMVIAALVSVLLSQREVGAVTGIASVVSGAVSALFFKQSQAASARLVRMTDDLAELRSISMAQHIAQTMETAPERDKAKAGIVEALLGSPGAGARKKGRGKKI